jgi:hypothetical protein
MKNNYPLDMQADDFSCEILAKGEKMCYNESIVSGIG